MKCWSAKNKWKALKTTLALTRATQDKRLPPQGEGQQYKKTKTNYVSHHKKSKTSVWHNRGWDERHKSKNEKATCKRSKHWQHCVQNTQTSMRAVGVEEKKLCQVGKQNGFRVARVGQKRYKFVCTGWRTCGNARLLMALGPGTKVPKEINTQHKNYIRKCARNGRGPLQDMDQAEPREAMRRYTTRRINTIQHPCSKKILTRQLMVACRTWCWRLLQRHIFQGATQVYVFIIILMGTPKGGGTRGWTVAATSILFIFQVLHNTFFCFVFSCLCTSLPIRRELPGNALTTLYYYRNNPSNVDIENKF